MCASARAQVRYVGKPHGQIYDAALDALAALGVRDRARIVGVGDSLHHDVQARTLPPLWLTGCTC